jgi:hypothetical protein
MYRHLEMYNNESSSHHSSNRRLILRGNNVMEMAATVDQMMQFELSVFQCYSIFGTIIDILTSYSSYELPYDWIRHAHTSLHIQYIMCKQTCCSLI